MDNNVNVGFTAVVFSGHATWNGNAGNSSWSTNPNWGDVSSGVAGAPGLSGVLSIGDTATFTDGSNEVVGGTTTVNLNGFNPSLAGMTFSSSNTIYNIATGSTAGGVITLQSGATMSVTTGTGVISATLSGAGPLTVAVAPGSDLIWSGSEAYTGSANITSGTLTMVNPTWLGQTAGTNIYNINPGGVLQWNVNSGSYISDAVKDNTYIQGSGTLQVTGGAFYISQGLLSIQMSAGGVLEIGNGATLVNGGNGFPGLIWTNNLGSLQLDSGGSINMWNNAPVIVDALTGSGTVNRIGSGNGSGDNFTMGANNGSGTFNGTLTNGFGTLNITKAGTGTQVLTGANSYSGSTTIMQGVLRITNGAGLGFGAQTFVAQGGQFTTTVLNGGTLDINGGITLNNAVTLSGGNLINSAAGTTSVLDSGIAGVTFTTDPNVAGSVVVTITGGSGSGATAGGGYVSSANFSQVYKNGAANNTANDYVQMATAGSGYMATGTGAPTASITIGGAANTGTDAVVVSSLILMGANDIGGSGNLTINAQISGTGGFTTVGTGTVTLANFETYTGPTTLGVGTTLQLGTGYSYTGSIGGSGSVIVISAGPAILAGINTYTGSTAINAGSTLQLGNGTTDGAIVSSTVSINGALIFDTKGNQNLPAVISGTGAITMSGTGNQELSGVNTYTGPTNINSGTLQLGSTTASGSTSHITVSSTGALSFTNGNTTQTTNLGISGQALTLNNGSTLVFGLTNTSADKLIVSGGASLSLNGTTYIDPALLSGTGGTFVIITDGAGFQGSGSFALGPLPALSSGSLSQTGTSVTITFSGISAAYWNGNGSTQAGYWSDFTNFTSDPQGTGTLTGTFGGTQDVIFSGTNVNTANQTAGLNYLDYNAIAHSLIINDPAGVDIGNLNNTLTLDGIAGHTGITVNSSAGANLAEIDTAVDLAGTPNITVYNSGGLLITGGISGNNGLLINGTGLLTLTGNDTYSGGTTLVGGTLNLSADNNLGAGGPGNGLTFNPGAGNSVMLQYTGGLTLNIAHPVTFASGTGIIDPGPSSVINISGAVMGTGALELVDTGKLVLSGSVAFDGTALINSGTLSLTFPGTLAQTGSVAFNTVPGSVLVLNDTGFQNIAPLATADGVAFTGNGTVLVAGGPGEIQMHGNSSQGTA